MRYTLGMFATIPVLLLFTAGHGIRAAQDGASPWRGDWEKARVEARVAKKPLFVVFR